MIDKAPPYEAYKAPPLSRSAVCSSGLSLATAIQSWLLMGEADGWSAKSLLDRRQSLNRFVWWLEHETRLPSMVSAVDATTVRAFLVYVRKANPHGRFGCSHPNAKREARPSTVQTYYRDLHAFFSYCLDDGLLSDSPMRRVKAPQVPVDEVQPLSASQVQLLLDAARRLPSARRNVALVILLVDTGLRIGEACGLTIKDFDPDTLLVTVRGKGNKRRTVPYHPRTRRFVLEYREHERRHANADEPLFVSDFGRSAGEALTPSGVAQFLRKAGGHAGLTGVRVSPHTLRHTFALEFLRAGGNVLELQRILGHRDLAMVRRYVQLAEADIAAAHRRASPAAAMKLR